METRRKEARSQARGFRKQRADVIPREDEDQDGADREGRKGPGQEHMPTNMPETASIQPGGLKDICRDVAKGVAESEEHDANDGNEINDPEKRGLSQGAPAEEGAACRRKGVRPGIRMGRMLRENTQGRRCRKGRGGCKRKLGSGRD